MWIDSHTHIQLCQDPEAVFLEALQELNYFVCVATQLSDFETLYNLKQRSKKVFFSIGEHPCHDLSNIDYDLLEKYVQQADLIGETGFDAQGDLNLQHLSFQKHAQLAKKYNKPIILHTRNAEEETMAAIQNFPDIKGVFHCFTGSQKLADFAIKMGWYISFSGIITFKKCDDLRAIAKTIPKDRILIETDAPYLAPEPYRGVANRPVLVKHTGAYLAQLLCMHETDFAGVMQNNLLQLIS